MTARSIIAAVAFWVFLSSPTHAEDAKRYIVCFGHRHVGDMTALVKDRDQESARLYARLHCWKIVPPARDPLLGTKGWTPFPNLPKMSGGRWKLVKWWIAEER